ncbi:NRDE family protein [Antarcticibacterium flavum]|uniref:NRDE family protein n=1 Tax=Antarcticibacterium flavum TaxID=2058175 RepID=A0A5B7X563_9FLAO|nr:MULTISPECIES: NRDE family protein [Antarcticibacterium]MCM4160064.1 hypothetical protein [Antarcticibacterium sp. W02-3]QCY70350.1 NRDE family protein [Antarcticibacterium flavum]
MCTVTLIPLKSGFVLTSNRDEAANRETIPPQVYRVEEVEMAFPKDKVAGGTWIGVSEHKRLICLLNGAFEDHIRELPYRKSRGVVVREMLATPNASMMLKDYLLENIEPFTLIMVDWKEELGFWELVWDGEKRHISKLPLKEHVWSSTPLYNAEMRDKRRSWFDKLKNSSALSPAEVWEFHHSGGEGDPETDLVMDRGFVKTQSITQIEKSGAGTILIYEDLSEKSIKRLKLEF